MKIIDAHSHIDFMTHREQMDVVETVCCTVDEFQWEVLLDMVKHSDKIYPAFGIHPWYIKFLDDGFESRLENLLKTNSSFMVGEIGLDKYKPDMDKQIAVFEKQFDLAVKLHRTIFIHCVGAWDKILHILKQYKQSELPIIVMHSYNGNEQITNELLNYDNIMFSFNKIDEHYGICRIQQIPTNKILVETDGKRDVVLSGLINEISHIKQDDDIAETIYNNTLQVINR